MYGHVVNVGANNGQEVVVHTKKKPCFECGSFKSSWLLSTAEPFEKDIFRHKSVTVLLLFPLHFGMKSKSETKYTLARKIVTE